MTPLPVYDKTGREIHVGDILKVYHFQGARWRKHYYMYKRVEREVTLGKGDNQGAYFYVSHLSSPDEDGYHIYRDGSYMSLVEIVESLDDHYSRPRTQQKGRAT